MLGLMVVMFASTALMVRVLFSAIITERRRELGLLKAIGARRSQIVGMLLMRSRRSPPRVGGLIGCVLGVLLLRIFEHSLVYYLDSVGVPFALARRDEHPADRPLLHCRCRRHRSGGCVLSGLAREPGRRSYDLIRARGLSRC